MDFRASVVFDELEILAGSRSCRHDHFFLVIGPLFEKHNGKSSLASESRDPENNV